MKRRLRHPEDNPQERREALTTLLDELQPQPRPPEPAVRIREVQVKSGPLRYVATGTLSGGREDALAALDTALEQDGMTVADSSSSDHFLGWTLLATREHMVLRADVGPKGAGRHGAPHGPTGRVPQADHAVARLARAA